MNRAKLDFLSLASLAVAAPLLLFPKGVLPWLGVGVMVAAAIWRASKEDGWRLQLRREDIPLVYLAGMALVGLGISIEPDLSWPRWWALLFGLLVFTTLRSALDVARQERWIAGGLALGGLGLAAISLMGTDWSNVRMVDLPWLYDRLPALIRGVPGSGVAQASDLFNPRWVGMTMATLAPACLALVGWRKVGWVRALAGLAFLVLTGTLLLTQSVQGLMGWAVGVFIVLLFASRWFWLLLPVGALAAVGLALKLDWAQVGQAMLSLENPAGAAVVLRLDIWRQAWAMLADLPFTGIGLNTFQVVQHEFYPGYLIGPEPHAHNLFLQTALDLGLPGLAAFVWFLTAWVWKGLQTTPKYSFPPRRVAAEGLILSPCPPLNSDGTERLLLVGALAGVGAYLAAGLIDAMMLGAKPGFVVWALLGIGAAVVKSKEASALRPSPAGERAGGDGSSPRHATNSTAWVEVTYWGTWLALPVLVGLAALVWPGKAELDLGELQAMHALHPYPAAPGMGNENLVGAASKNLARALVYDPNAGQAYLLLGRLAGAAGDFEGAQAHYAVRVALDLRDPVMRYNLTLGLGEWLGLASCSEAAPELQKVYQAWNTRFSDRAETYFLKSVLLETYLGDVQGAQNTLQAGMKAQALPLGLLADALK